MEDNRLSNKIAISTSHLTIGYRGKRVGRDIVIEDNISEKLYAGEIVCLLGPNGAGKSTLLRTLSGFLPPLGGEIEIDGKRLEEISPKELARRVSVVLTERPAFENLRVEQLVGLGRSPYTGFFGRLTVEDYEIIDSSMRLAGIDKLRGRNAATLSDGERQKVMIAKALAQQTKVIFLDEPTAFLDYPSKVETMQLLRRLCEEEGKCVFLSTHDLDIALQTTDRLWLMSRREGLSCGTVEELGERGTIGKYFDAPGIMYDASTHSFNICT
ncbi:MAG: ABC transporter ATP-binding protein [Clostridium sp.]|nr:ABC transporter ATP-binding protein [Prevotella sp.]MCM1429367.1 ABC transporter ATP-binding protein [Clostridium sp.]MCM1475598.1 ABC transporter ATP-binding protein [Muribaculaceae bacterium]